MNELDTRMLLNLQAERKIAMDEIQMLREREAKLLHRVNWLDEEIANFELKEAAWETLWID